MLPSLMHSFVRQSSIRELCPPALLLLLERERTEGRKREKFYIYSDVTHTHIIFLCHTSTFICNFVTTTSTTSFVFPSFPVPATTFGAHCWKKLTCGVIRSLNCQFPRHATLFFLLWLQRRPRLGNVGCLTNFVLM